jgi:hypothetical protein
VDLVAISQCIIEQISAAAIANGIGEAAYRARR